MVMTRWHDKREFVTLSSFHKPELCVTHGGFKVREKLLALIYYTVESA